VKWLRKVWKWLSEFPRNESPLANFTPRAQQVLALARREADRLNQHQVDAGHLLSALAVFGEGVAANVLRRKGVDLARLRLEAESQLASLCNAGSSGHLPFTNRAKHALACAQKEARALGHTYVGTEHILLGLLRDGDQMPARLLNRLGLTIGETRQEVLRELDPNFGMEMTGGEPQGDR
jgi:ATP-dependent Clp protease ATP-binding subunit ClpC